MYRIDMNAATMMAKDVLRIVGGSMNLTQTWHTWPYSSWQRYKLSTFARVSMLLMRIFLRQKVRILKKIYAMHLFIPTEFISGYAGPSMGQFGMLKSYYSTYKMWTRSEKILE